MIINIRLPFSIRLLHLAALFAASLLLSGCASNTQWYKAGQTQADFDREEQDCLRVAEELSRQGTVTGRKNVELFVKAYNSCLFSKGWNNIPSTNRTAGAVRPESAPLQELVSLPEPTQMAIFGYTLDLPATFRLHDRNFSTMGPTRTDALLWKDEDGTVVSCIAQKGDLGIKATGYPVPPPLQIYDRGLLPEGDPFGTRWTTFFGTFGTDRIMGLGAFIPGAHGERIVMTITSSLPEGPTEPAPGLALEPGQKQFMDSFTRTWRTRLPAPMPQSSASLKRLLHYLQLY